MRARLISLVVATTTLVALAFVLPLAFLVRELAEDRAVRPAELATRTLAPAVALRGADELQPLVDAAAAGLPGPVGVALPSGEIVGARPPAGIVERATRERRAEQVELDDGLVAVVPVVVEGGTGVVYAFVPGAALHEGVATAWSILGGLALLLVLGGALLADALARRTLAAVDEVEATARRLAGGDLSARADVRQPEEIARVGAVLGMLAGRIEELLRAEREAAADLSHRLRTPLTPLRVDVEALPESPRRAQLLADVDALAAEVSRVIDAFRGPGSIASAGLADAATVVRQRASFWAPLAEDQGRSFELDVAAAGSVAVPLVDDDLSDAVDALIGNVFDHTSEGVGLALRLAVEDDHVRIEVSDRGPGWPDGLEVLERGTSGAGRSTGLGLDIARRVARSAGGRLELGTAPSGGASAALVLPITT